MHAALPACALIAAVAWASGVTAAVLCAAALLAGALVREWWTQRGEVVEEEPPARVFEPRAFTTAELAWYDGVRNAAAARRQRSPPTGPGEHPLPEYDDLIFVGVKGVVYNVAAEWYGPSSPYNAFAGVDASRQLGKVKVGREEANAHWAVRLSEEHLKTLDEWEAKFKSKYSVAGWVVVDDSFEAKAREFDP